MYTIAAAGTARTARGPGGPPQPDPAWTTAGPPAADSNFVVNARSRVILPYASLLVTEPKGNVDAIRARSPWIAFTGDHYRL